MYSSLSFCTATCGQVFLSVQQHVAKSLFLHCNMWSSLTFWTATYGQVSPSVLQHVVKSFFLKCNMWSNLFLCTTTCGQISPSVLLHQTVNRHTACVRVCNFRSLHQTMFFYTTKTLNALLLVTQFTPNGHILVNSAAPFFNP